MLDKRVAKITDLMAEALAEMVQNIVKNEEEKKPKE